MLTKGEVKLQMLRWLDEATSNGQPAPEDQIADLKDRADHLLDGVVKFLAGHFKIPAVHTVVRAPIKNLLGIGFPMSSVVPPDTYKKTMLGGKSFYLEVYGDVTIFVTSNGVKVYDEQITADQFSAVKSNIPNAAENITLEITSDYPFVVRNAAVYPCAYPTDEAVPDYIPYVPYELPENYRQFDKLLQTSDRHEYRRFPDYRREGLRTFLLPYDAAGQFDFHYFRNPADIPPDAPDDTVIEVEEHAAQLVALKLAVDCTIGVEDTMSVGYYLDNRFNLMLTNLLTDDDAEPVSIDTVYQMT